MRRSRVGDHPCTAGTVQDEAGSDRYSAAVPVLELDALWLFAFPAPFYPRDPPHRGIAPNLGPRLFCQIQKQRIEGVAHHVVAGGPGREVGAPEGSIAPADEIAAGREEPRVVEPLRDSQQGEELARAGGNGLGERRMAGRRTRQ